VVDIDITYDGSLHCTAAHRPSGKKLETDAPADNHGRGESFSPTDLVATALGTCMATTMNIFARDRDYRLEGMRVHVKKLMTPPPRRIARLEVEITLPPNATASVPLGARAELENAAHTCPVRVSLLDAVDVPVRFDWLSE